jgi:cytidylate kinase
MTSRPPLVIAIDGPAGAGKSTTAREVARRLGLYWVDTGAMYRAVTLWFLRHEIEPLAGRPVEDALRRITVDLIPAGEGLRVLLCGDDVTERIRQADVNRLVSRVARLPQVRKALVDWQRHCAARGDVVMEGRDIGTVVCPGAPVKIFLHASLEARANRRTKEFASLGEAVDDSAVRRNLVERDEADSTRDISPLVPAGDAVLLDTSDLSIEEQVDAVIRIVRARGYGRRLPAGCAVEESPLNG